MKKCPLCGAEYTEGNTCPICGVLLIDTESNKAVEVEDPKRIHQREKEMQRQERERQKQQKAETKKQHTGGGTAQISVNPKMLIIGAIIAVLLIVCIVLGVKLSKSNKSGDMGYETTGTVDENVPDEDYSDAQEEVTLRDEDFAQSELVTFETDSFEFKLPMYWKNLCRVENEKGFITFYQKKSEEAGEDGWLFTVVQTDDYNLDKYVVYDKLEEKGSDIYAIVYPEGYTYDTSDKYAALEYKRLMEDVNDVIGSFNVTKKNSGDYVIPDSNSRYLTKADLTSLSKEELLHARNEIYARHGRKFQDAGIQAYFNSKSWYKGTINPEAFTESMLNEYEKKNATFILSYEKEKGYM